MPPTHIPERLRLAELIAALSLATDLGMGQPMAHALRTCLIALKVGRALGYSEPVLADTYYTSLLRFVGCTSDAHEFLDFAAGEDIGLQQTLAGVANGTPDEVAQRLTRFLTTAGVTGDVAIRVRNALGSRHGTAARSMTAHCEVASMLATRLNLGATVCNALGHAFERWDGHGFPDGQSGEEVPPAVRLALIARDIEVLTRTYGLDDAQTIVRRRRGRAHDPRAVDAFVRHGAAIMRDVDQGDPWTEVLKHEPGEPTHVPADRLDEVLTAFADFADVKTPFTLGHSRAVAQLCDRAGTSLGFSPAEIANTRRAALLHDLGRTGVPNSIWERRAPLSVDQWERVRLHPYYTERILSCCTFLHPIGMIAGSHHERLDGSGYHRRLRGGDLDRPSRLLAVADACRAMLQQRPHRPALTPEQAARELNREVTGARLDRHIVEAVLGATGNAPARKRRVWPNGLTDREVEVLRLMAKGASNRRMGAALGITPKTVGHHVQHIYGKIGCSTRAAAAVFAIEQGLL